MARERGSTGYSTDVLDAGKMAASLQKVPATALLTNTSRRDKANKRDGTQSLQHKLEGSGGIGCVGEMAEVHHSTQKGMAVFALEWC